MATHSTDKPATQAKPSTGLAYVFFLICYVLALLAVIWVGLKLQK